MDQRKHEAKLKFAEAFVTLSESTPIDKITVGQIAKVIGKTRKAFYCHFSDQRELVTWLFRYDLARELESTFPKEVLVYRNGTADLAEPESEAFDDLPFYVRNITPEGSIDNSLFFEALSRCLEKRRPYYKKLLSRVGFGTLDGYLHRIYTPCLKDDVIYLVERELSTISPMYAESFRKCIEDALTVDFLSEFYTGAFISRLIRRMHDAGANRTMEDIRPFENVIHESLELMISAHIRQSILQLDAKEPGEGGAR